MEMQEGVVKKNKKDKAILLSFVFNLIIQILKVLYLKVRSNTLSIILFTSILSESPD